MTATTTENNLSSRLNIGAVTTWRLHWLLCELCSLKQDIQTAQCGSRVAQLHNGPFAELLARVKRVEGSYARIRWETKTMLGLDYEDEVEHLFASLPKNADYAAELAEVKGLLQRIVDKVLAEEAQQLRSSIHR